MSSASLLSCQCCGFVTVYDSCIAGEGNAILIMTALAALGLCVSTELSTREKKQKKNTFVGTLACPISMCLVCQTFIGNNSNYSMHVTHDVKVFFRYFTIITIAEKLFNPFNPTARSEKNKNKIVIIIIKNFFCDSK